MSILDLNWRETGNFFHVHRTGKLSKTSTFAEVNFIIILLNRDCYVIVHVCSDNICNYNVERKELGGPGH
jgi:hypothetical protein